VISCDKDLIAVTGCDKGLYDKGPIAVTVCDKGHIPMIGCDKSLIAVTDCVKGPIVVTRVIYL
jgi:hypothetical protein